MPTTDSPTASRPRVLSIGGDPSLLVTRRLVLELAHFDVVSSTDIETPEQLSAALQQNGAFDVCLIAQSLPVPERLALARSLRQSAPATAVVMFHYPGESFDARDCDGLLAVPCRPQQMIATIQRALKKASARRPNDAASSASGC